MTSAVHRHSGGVGESCTDAGLTGAIGIHLDYAVVGEIRDIHMPSAIHRHSSRVGES